MKFRTFLIVTLLFVSLCFSAGLAADLDYAIHLATGDLYPDKLLAIPAIVDDLIEQHLLIQFDRPVTDLERATLATQGIQLLDYIPNYAYTARLTTTLSARTLGETNIRWLGPIVPTQKVSPRITDLGFTDWVRRDDDRVALIVVLHRDEDANAWSDRLMADYSADIIGHEPSINSLDIEISEAFLWDLAALDAVLWIEPALPEPQVDNDQCRTNMDVNTVNAAPLGLTGAGVTVGEWDGGRADLDHLDLGNVISMDGSSIHYHATHVAGTVVGLGIENANYKGMAPGASLLTQLWWGSSSEMISEYLNAIASRDMSISTNSWGYGVGDPATESSCQSTLGNYFTIDATIDNVVRGASGVPVTILFSAGNQRGSSSKYCGSIGWSWGTIGPTAVSKNVISVGAINSNNSSMTSFSSWGPTDDGRIKPDVVGPGCQSNGDGGVTSCRNGGGYRTLCGTSMSTPAVAGVVALMREQWNTSVGGFYPLPSTIKGVIINTADDLGNPGPDFQYGHGRVNALAACTKIGIGAPSYVESAISTGQSIGYDLTVTTSTPLKVTLVWDDPGGTSGASAHLINDLDLVLVDPFGAETEPWSLDPANPSWSATTGVDRRNNVETVEISSPTPGLWTARVDGYNIPTGPQNFTIVFSPDSIHTPGNTRALAVFDQGDVTENPGDIAAVGFWVTNVGAGVDTVIVNISDDAGWLSGSIVDSTLELNPYDSALFTLSANIPSGALATDQSVVTCLAASLLAGGVSANGEVVVSAAAMYAMTVSTGLVEDTVSSPDTFTFDVIVTNQANADDQLYVAIEDVDGWSAIPAQQSASLTPEEAATLTFTINIPVEVAHLHSNTISVIGSSNGGAVDTATFALIGWNPVFPPALVGPDDHVYSQLRNPNFDWTGDGESYTLYIANDANIISLLHTYPGIVTTDFTPPLEDSLADGTYWWAVRSFVGPDSSSLQQTPFEISVDNTPPVGLIPAFPVDTYTNDDPLIIGISVDGVAPPTVAPEFNRIEFASDVGFTTDLMLFDSVSQFSYQLPETPTDGRWYWRAAREDLAGNSSGYSAPATFLMDRLIPSVPTIIEPTGGDIVGGDSLLFNWSTDPLPEWETAPDYWFLQIGGEPNYSDPVFSGYVYSDSVYFAGTSFVEDEDYFWRVKALDSAGHYTAYTSQASLVYLNFICGDVDRSGEDPHIGDLTYLIGFLFIGGTPPDPYASGAVDCDQFIDVSDLTWMINYLFLQGADLCCQPN